MKRILLFALPMLLAASSAWALGVKDVIAMQRAGITNSLIEQRIEYSGTVFHLSANAMRDLEDAGVSDEVISTMLKTEAPQEGIQDVYWQPAPPPTVVYAVPYDPPYDDDPHAPYVSVRFDVATHRYIRSYRPIRRDPVRRDDFRRAEVRR